MKREFNFIPEDENDSEDEYVDNFYNSDEEEDCPYMEFMSVLAFQEKPFGYLWPKDKVIEFLKARGYKLIDRKADNGDEYTVAVKPNSSSIPDDGHENLKEAFDSEMQDIILKWVLRIAKENDGSN